MVVARIYNHFELFLAGVFWVIHSSMGLMWKKQHLGNTCLLLPIISKANENPAIPKAINFSWSF